MRWWWLPADGIGLARMEFLITNVVRAHPMALAHLGQLKDATAKETIATLAKGYIDAKSYFVETLSLGLAQLAALAHPKPAIVRLSDFKSNEYATLVGGAEFEVTEESPMIGFRGASHYYSPKYQDAFRLECEALRRLRETIGFKNVVVMVPFCRTVHEAQKVLEIMDGEGLRRGTNGFQIFMMCEIPSNVILAEEFAKYFDGFSIGSKDLTQLTLGVDRDSPQLAELFSEQDPAVKWMIKEVIRSDRQD